MALFHAFPGSASVENILIKIDIDAQRQRRRHLECRARRLRALLATNSSTLCVHLLEQTECLFLPVPLVKAH
jgi:hypothetical protein